MISTFFRKEWRQHWLWLLLLGLATAVLVALASMSTMVSGAGGGTFSGVGYGMIFVIPFACLILSNRLVTHEYQNRTQIFLEGLPVRRWGMIATKYAFCCFFICLYVVFSILLGWLISSGSETVTLRFLAIMLVSGFGWGLFLMSFFFALGFLGKYRLALLLVVVAVVVYLNQKIGLPVKDFPPYALVEPGVFGLERDLFPIQNLKWAGILFGVFTVLSFVLGLVKEGSIGAMMGERMSYREVIFVGGTVTLLMLSAAELVDQKVVPEPIIPLNAIHEEYEGVKVWVAPKDQKKKDVDREIQIASNLARRLAEERDWLGMSAERFPRVLVYERSDIKEPEKIMDEDVPDHNIIKMYADYSKPVFTEGRLLCWTLSAVVRKYSFERVSHEDRWWIVCGLEGLWELTEADSETLEKRYQMANKAVEQEGLTMTHLLDWHKYQEDVEWRHADAVAWMGMRLLKEKKGIEVVQKLARATVVQYVTREDSRPVIWDLTNPVESTFEEVTGIPLKDFVKDWKAEILSHKKTDKEESK